MESTCRPPRIPQPPLDTRYISMHAIWRARCGRRGGGSAAAHAWIYPGAAPAPPGPHADHFACDSGPSHACRKTQRARSRGPGGGCGLGLRPHLPRGGSKGPGRRALSRVPCRAAPVPAGAPPAAARKRRRDGQAAPRTAFRGATPPIAPGLPARPPPRSPLPSPSPPRRPCASGVGMPQCAPPPPPARRPTACRWIGGGSCRGA